MAGRDVVVVGASLGGVQALRTLVQGLPADFPAAMYVVQHLPPTARSLLPEILTRVGTVPAEPARDGLPLQPGRIYVAPPDVHLRLEAQGVRLVGGPRVNNQRPAADVLFRSAAQALGPRVIGVVLTGALDCGAAGLHAIHAAGGLAVVQSPDDAACPDMPLHALELTPADHVAPVAELGPLLGRLVREELPLPQPAPPTLERDLEERPIHHYACPACGGALEPAGDPATSQLRCHVGHGFSPAGLEAAQRENLEAALWTALRTLEEQGQLLRDLAGRAAQRHHEVMQGRYAERAREADAQARLIRQVLGAGGGAG